MKYVVIMIGLVLLGACLMSINWPWALTPEMKIRQAEAEAKIAQAEAQKAEAMAEMADQQADERVLINTNNTHLTETFILLLFVSGVIFFISAVTFFAYRQGAEITKQ